MKKIVAVILLLTAVGAVLVFRPKRPEPVAATPTPVPTSWFNRSDQTVRVEDDLE